MKIEFNRISFRVSQSLSHGRKNRLSGQNLAHKARPALPENIGLKVRFLKGGIMYATKVVRPPQKAKVSSARTVSASARRPAAPHALGGMLGQLTAIEAANRLQAHKQNQNA